MTFLFQLWSKAEKYKKTHYEKYKRKSTENKIAYVQHSMDEAKFLHSNQLSYNLGQITFATW